MDLQEGSKFHQELDEQSIRKKEKEIEIEGRILSLEEKVNSLRNLAQTEKIKTSTYCEQLTKDFKNTLLDNEQKIMVLIIKCLLYSF